MIDQETVMRVIRLLQEDVEKINERIIKLENKPDSLLNGEWMDGQDVMLALHISQRTLRTLRASGKLTMTRILKKYYYNVADIKSLLEENYISHHLTYPSHD